MTNTMATAPTTAPDIVQAAAALAPQLKARAAEIEAANQLPLDVVDALQAAGIFRLLIPAELGGAEADLSTALDLLDALAAADPSTAWTAMIGAGVWLDLAAMPRITIDALFGDGPDVRIAGVFNPTGAAVATRDGYEVRGRWAFASGCTHAQWIYVNCAEEVAGEHRLRTALLPAAEVEIEHTWDVVGLRGTGSHHLRIDGGVVPAERTCVVFADPPTVDAPIIRVPVPTLLALAIAAVALGTAAGAVDDVTSIAAARTPLLSAAPLDANPLYHHDLATARVELDARRALLQVLGSELWAVATTGDGPDLELRARVRAAAVNAVDRAVAVVQAAFRAGGGGAVYATSPLQRRLRDVHTIAQHFLVRPDTMVTAGAVFAGRDLDVPIF